MTRYRRLTRPIREDGSDTGFGQGGDSFSPLDLSPALWLDASDASTLYTDAAASFDSANNEFLEKTSIGTDLQTGDVDFWAAAWVYLPNKSARYTVVFSGTGLAASQVEWWLDYDNSSDRFRFVIGDSGGGTYKIASANNLGSPSTGTWYLLLGWHDSSNDTINIKVSGGTTDSTATGGDAPGAQPGALRIGVLTSGVTPFNGRIDSLGFGKPSGAIADIIDDISTSLYNSGDGKVYADLTAAEKSDWGLVSWWNLDAASGTRYDAHGTNDLTDNNTVTVAAGIAASLADDGDPSFLYSREGNDYLFTNSTHTARPLREADSPGYLIFNGLGDVLRAGDQSSLESDDWSWWLVWRRNDSDAGFAYVGSIQGDISGGNACGATIGLASHTLRMVTTTGSGQEIDTGTATFGPSQDYDDFNILIIEKSGTSLKSWVNGNPDIDTTLGSATMDWTGAPKTVLGGAFSSSSLVGPTELDLQSELWFTSPLTTLEKNNGGRYFASLIGATWTEIA